MMSSEYKRDVTIGIITLIHSEGNFIIMAQKDGHCQYWIGVANNSAIL